MERMERARSIRIPDVGWLPAEREALCPPRKIKPADWAEKYRYLSPSQTSRPGKWRNKAAPHLVGLMNLCAVKVIAELNVQKCSQAGASEGFRNVLGWWADTQVDPALLNLPDKEKGKQIIGLRVQTLFEETPRLRRLLSGRSRDTKLDQIVLNNGFMLHLGYSGSGSSLKSHPARLVKNDEVDEFQIRVGQETDPIHGGKKRQRTFDNPLMLNLSTPGKRAVICRLVEGSHILILWKVYCPHCGALQALEFARLRWETPPEFGKDRLGLAAWLIGSKAFWYECAECEGRIEEDKHKRKMLQGGVWATEEDQIIVDAAGNVTDDLPPGNSVGAKFNAIGVLWAKWGDIIDEFLKALHAQENGDIQPMFEFKTQTLGEEFIDEKKKVEANTFAVKCMTRETEDGRTLIPGEAGLVPGWAVKLLMTVDTQKNHFWVVMRAWGYGMRSRRIWHGRVETFEELTDLLNSSWRYEGEKWAAIGPELMAIDAGGGNRKAGVDGFETTRTEEVYQYALGNPGQIKPFIGASERQGMNYSWKTRDYTPVDRRREKYEVGFFYVDVHWAKDLLAGWIEGEMPDVDRETGEVLSVERWELNDANDATYNRQMASERAVLDPATGVTVWQRHHSENHYWDCEAYQVALAHIARVQNLLPLEEMEAMMRGERETVMPRGVSRPDGRAWSVLRR